MKDDERRLLLEIHRRKPKRSLAQELLVPPVYVRDIWKELGMNGKRACYLFDKWDLKGWYEYGVSVDLGWLTDLGHAEAERLA